MGYNARNDEIRDNVSGLRSKPSDLRWTLVHFKNTAALAPIRAFRRNWYRSDLLPP